MCERLSRGGGGTSVLLVKSLLAKGGGIRLHRTIFTTMASGHRMKYPTFLPRIITSPLYHRHFPRHVLISPPAPVYVSSFSSSFFSLFFERESNFVQLRRDDTRGNNNEEEFLELDRFQRVSIH